MLDGISDQQRAAWLAAIDTRHSRRRYEPQPVDAAILDDLAAVCGRFRPWPNARVELARGVGSELFFGIVGAYGGVTGTPNVLVIVGDVSSGSCHQHAGYTGEAAVLHATSLGLSTCWVAGMFSPAAANRVVTLAEGERVLAVTPLGYAPEGFTVTERLLRGSAHAARRRPLDVIAPGIGPDWPQWAYAAVEAARRAPSAMNRQPWRFRIEHDALVVSQDSASETPKVTKALDCGIAMLHAELAARVAGVVGRWEDVVGEGLDVARFVTVG